MTAAPYPARPSARRGWIEALRGPRNPAASPHRPYAFFVEQECLEGRAIVSVATIFLTNRECPWRCLMCDLWKNTTNETVPFEAIPAQIDFALEELSIRGGGPRPGHIKLYNSGSFFDRAAVPMESHDAIVKRLSRFDRVIVECHPRLVSDAVVRFRDCLGAHLEVAMGLETANPETLARLNKGMTLEDFTNAAKFLVKNGIGVRAFILLKPPFTTEAEGVHWAKRSINFAFDSGASVASIIPTRSGNGAMEALQARGEFSQPRLASLEEALDYGIGLQHGCVFADLWELERFSECASCFSPRQERLRGINLSQNPHPRVTCIVCEN